MTYENPLLTPRQVAALLGIAVAGVRVYALRGLIRAAPLAEWYDPRHPMYVRASVLAYLARRRGSVRRDGGHGQSPQE